MNWKPKIKLDKGLRIVIDSRRSYYEVKFSNKYFYPLLENGFSDSDIRAGINVLKSKFITMGKHTQNLKNILQKSLNVNMVLWLTQDHLLTYFQFLHQKIH